MKDYLTEAVTGSRIEYQCARCGGPAPYPRELEEEIAELGHVPPCPTCGHPLDALKKVGVLLNSRQTMAGMRPATPAVN